MIHKIYVSSETELGELKKNVRKKLMTGGAVLRIEESAPEAELSSIFERFSPAAERNNLAAEILVQLAGHPALSGELRARLGGVALPEVRCALSKAN